MLKIFVKVVCPYNIKFHFIIIIICFKTIIIKCDFSFKTIVMRVKPILVTMVLNLNLKL